MSRSSSKGFGTELRRRLGSHMLRHPPAAMSGGHHSLCVAGLGVFKSRDHARCCHPLCGADDDVWGVWLVNGTIVVLRFCMTHAHELLVFDEYALTQEAARARRQAAAEAP